MKYSIEINGKTLELVEGDITTQDVDTIVNAANSGLRGGGGVDGAIHKAGGPEIMNECRTIGGCPTGHAVITTAGKLKAEKVIHTVGPIWRGGNTNEPTLLRSAYMSSLKIAEENGMHSIAFPSISTGVYSYPLDEASKIALKTIIEYLKGKTQIETVKFVLFGRENYEAYKNTLQKITLQDIENINTEEF